MSRRTAGGRALPLSAGQPGEHAGVDQRLGNEEQVGRAAAGQARHRIELRSGTRTTVPTAPRIASAHRDRPRPPAARGDRRGTLADQRGVFGIALTTATP